MRPSLGLQMAVRSHLAWRRKPDAKWRLTEDALGRRMQEQVKVLDEAKHFVKPGGLLFYVCLLYTSTLPTILLV